MPERRILGGGRTPWCLLLTFSELFGWWRLISPVSLTRPACRKQLMQTVTMGPGRGGRFRAACSPHSAVGWLRPLRRVQRGLSAGPASWRQQPVSDGGSSESCLEGECCGLLIDGAGGGWPGTVKDDCSPLASWLDGHHVWGRDTARGADSALSDTDVLSRCSA